MNGDVIDMNERGRELWEAYLAAKEKAELTQDFRDARWAGVLWGRFLDIYSRDQSPRGTILEFKRKTK